MTRKSLKRVLVRLRAATDGIVPQVGSARGDIQEPPRMNLRCVRL
jgi:hypothetical protein